MWEVCRRCISNGVALEYAMPYYEWLPSNNQEPSIEEMRKLVSFDQRRPPLPNRWHSDPVNYFLPILAFVREILEYMFIRAKKIKFELFIT